MSNRTPSHSRLGKNDDQTLAQTGKNSCNVRPLARRRLRADRFEGQADPSQHELWVRIGSRHLCQYPHLQAKSGSPHTEDFACAAAHQQQLKLRRVKDMREWSGS
jgi:hypothetical protein